ncbi:hypothetical protein ACJX0J_030989, partial [Zea mays]
LTRFPVIIYLSMRIFYTASVKWTLLRNYGVNHGKTSSWEKIKLILNNNLESVCFLVLLKATVFATKKIFHVRVPTKIISTRP